MRVVLINYLMNAKRKFKLPMPLDATYSELKRNDKSGRIFGLVLVSLLVAVVILIQIAQRIYFSG
jgi:hypothetical protein